MMNRLIAALLSIGITTTPVVAFQARGGGAAAGSSIKACSILTRDLVEPFAENKRTLDLIPPEEETMAAGSACEWGIVRLQLYPARPGATHTAPKDYQPLPGVGDAAFFHNNRNQYAELLVWSGAHNFTLQVSVPTGSTPDAIKPKTVDLANAIIKKLR
jgi:hypothetical protein